MDGVGRKAFHHETERAQPPTDRALAELAGRQYGVVALFHLYELGFTAAGVRSRVRRGRLHPIHRGVYAVGHSALAPNGRLMAAVLACGPEAVLSHRSAAALWGLRPSARSAIDVSAIGRAGRRRRGIDAHRADTLLARDRTTHLGIPCTTVARTLLDLAEVVDRRQLDRALDRAEALRLFDLAAIRDVLARANGRHGAGRLAGAVAGYEPALTRSELEVRFLSACTNAGLPAPLVNARIENLEVDFHWPRRRLIVETDGFETHGTRRAFENDRRRDQVLARAGWRVLRFTWGQVVRDPVSVAQTIEGVLAAHQ